jgi:hypothetical protein
VVTDEPAYPVLDFHCGFSATGSIEISERGQETSEGTFPNSVVLVISEAHRIDISVSINEEPPSIRMDTYHCENTDTGLGYHAHLEIPLDRRSAEALHRALGWLVDLL